MKTNLHILDHTGDTRITWDQANPTECEAARQTVADLKAAGYTFFLVDGTAIDEVGMGNGALIVRKIDAAELTEPSPTATEPQPEPEQGAQPKRRGRPPKNPPDQNVVAVRPLRGG